MKLPGKIKPSTILLALLIPALLLYYFAEHPFATTLAKRTINLSGFSTAHRLNFNSAVKRLDMTVIKPQQVFSFNQRLGPRDTGGGYVPAASYLGRDRVASSGGGICLVSSTLYQVALLSGLTIVERTPHVSRIASVPAGLDSTVWYGVNDLKILNPYDFPVEIVTTQSPEEVTIEIKGKALTKPVKRSFKRREIARDNRTMLVEVYLLEDTKSEGKLLSRDSYNIR